MYKSAFYYLLRRHGPLICKTAHAEQTYGSRLAQRVEDGMDKRDKTKAGLTGAVIASAPTSLRLAQYNLSDVPAMRDMINNTPVMSRGRAMSKLRIGDIGIHADLVPSVFDPTDMGWWAEAGQGSPFYHAMAVGPGKRLYSGGGANALGGAALVDPIGHLLHTAIAIRDASPADRRGLVTAYLRAPYGGADTYRARVNKLSLATKLRHGAEPPIHNDLATLFMRPQVSKWTPALRKDVATIIGDMGVKPYSTTRGVMAGLYDNLIPRNLLDKPIELRNYVTAMCSELPAKVLQRLGLPVQARYALPRDLMIRTPGLEPMFIASRLGEKATRASLLLRLAQEKAFRNKAGLAAIAGLAGAGTLAGRYLEGRRK